MKKVRLQFNLFFLLALALMLSACAVGNVAHEQIQSEQNLLPADALDNVVSPFKYIHPAGRHYLFQEVIA